MTGSCACVLGGAEKNENVSTEFKMTKNFTEGHCLVLLLDRQFMIKYKELGDPEPCYNQLITLD